MLTVADPALFPTQVFNKLLTLASTACQTNEFSLWNNLLVSTNGVLAHSVLLGVHCWGVFCVYRWNGLEGTLERCSFFDQV